MNEQESKRRFQIVPRVRRQEVTAGSFLSPSVGAQSTLFPDPRPGLLIFVFFPEVTEDEFRVALESAKPSVVVELRNTPTSKLATLTVRSFFNALTKSIPSIWI